MNNQKITRTYKHTNYAGQTIRFQMTVDLDELARTLIKKLRTSTRGETRGALGAIRAVTLHPENKGQPDIKL